LKVLELAKELLGGTLNVLPENIKLLSIQVGSEVLYVALHHKLLLVKSRLLLQVATMIITE
jgi:hypothetical protein